MPFVIPEEASVISDTTTSTTTTWSSTKIDAEIGMGGGGGSGVTINDENPSLTTVYSGTKTQTLINGITDLNFVGAYNPGASYGVNDVATYDGSSWRRVNGNGGNVGDVPSLSSYFWEALAVKGDQGIQGIQGIQGDAGLSSSLFEYRLDRNTFVATGIGNGDIRTNNSSLDLATNIWISHRDDPGRDVETFLAVAPVGSRILIQQKTQSSTWITYQVTGTVSQVVGSYVSFPVVYVSSSNGIGLTHNLLVLISIEFVAVPTISIGTVSTGSAGSSATVVNSGSSQNAVFDFTIPRGDTGGGTSSDLEYTLSMFTYYGTSWTVNLVNMMTSSIAHLGGSFTGMTQAGTSALTKSFRNKSNVSSTANGATTGWKGAGNSPFVYIGQGFKYTYSFALEDTTTNALTRSLIGLLQSTAPIVLNNTATVQSINDQSIGIMQESGENVWSFYTRGASSFQKFASSIPCTTPSTVWNTITLHNPPGSYDVIVSLTSASLTSTVTESRTFTCGTASTPLTTAPLYVILQRSMSSAGGVTGSASLSLGGIKMLYR